MSRLARQVQEARGARQAGELRIPDSQQPRVMLSVVENRTDSTTGGHLVFAVQENNFSFGVEKPTNAAAEKIKPLRNSNPKWFETK